MLDQFASLYGLLRETDFGVYFIHRNLANNFLLLLFFHDSDLDLLEFVLVWDRVLCWPENSDMFSLDKFLTK